MKNNCLNILIIVSLIVTACRTEIVSLKPLADIQSTKYYSADIIPTQFQSVYGVWKVTGTSGGFSGSGYAKDFDYLLLKPNGIFGIMKNDSLIGYGKLTLLNGNPLIYINSLQCSFDFEKPADIQLNYDNEKNFNLKGKDTLNLDSPCCDRYDTQLIRQKNDLFGLTNTGILKGKISIGPICPVETIPPRPECSPTAETYKNWQISVWNESKTQIIMDIVPALDGNYSVSLPAGKYVVAFKTTHSNSIGGNNLPVSINILVGDKVDLNINIDTGIR